MTGKFDLTAERLREVLDYCPDTGVFKWRVRKGIYPAGATAGSIDAYGYLRIRIDRGRLHLAHRLAWLYVHGRWPAELMDHVNGVRADNRIVNLREATHQQNSRNRKSVGFCFRPNKSRRNPFTVKITVNGKHKYVGSYSTSEAAREVFLDATRKQYGDFSIAVREDAQ